MRTRSFLWTLVLAALTILLGVSHVSGLEPPCDVLLPLDASAPLDGFDPDALFCLEVPSAGRLTVEVTSWAAGTFDRRPERQALAVDAPGWYLLHLGGGDLLPGSAVTARFSSSETPPPEGGSGESGGSDDDTEESNNEIVPFTAPGDPAGSAY